LDLNILKHQDFDSSPRDVTTSHIQLLYLSLTAFSSSPHTLLSLFVRMYKIIGYPTFRTSIPTLYYFSW